MLCPSHNSDAHVWCTLLPPTPAPPPLAPPSTRRVRTLPSRRTARYLPTHPRRPRPPHLPRPPLHRILPPPARRRATLAPGGSLASYGRHWHGAQTNASEPEERERFLVGASGESRSSYGRCSHNWQSGSGQGFLWARHGRTDVRAERPNKRRDIPDRSAGGHTDGRAEKRAAVPYNKQ